MAQAAHGWIVGCSRLSENAWIDELRSRGRRGKIFLAAEAGENIGTDSMARETELLSCSRHGTLAKISGKRESRARRGVALREAAEVLDVPIGTLTSD